MVLSLCLDQWTLSWAMAVCGVIKAWRMWGPCRFARNAELTPPASLLCYHQPHWRRGPRRCSCWLLCPRHDGGCSAMEGSSTKLGFGFGTSVCRSAVTRPNHVSSSHTPPLSLALVVPCLTLDVIRTSLATRKTVTSVGLLLCCQFPPHGRQYPSPPPFFPTLAFFVQFAKTKPVTTGKGSLPFESSWWLRSCWLLLRQPRPVRFASPVVARRR